MSATPTFDPAQVNHIHGLIIGIDDYQCPEYPPLQGAVADATQFGQYLLQDLKVPPRNIAHLFDRSASRENIINAFRALISDNTIVKNRTAIVIYYAGHGASSPKPDGWRDWEACGGEIELLCPTDIGQRDAAGNIIEGIPDRTIGVLLDDLSRAKGNNITLVLDCCCSAGMTRAPISKTEADLVPRLISSPPRISDTCDFDVWSTHQRGAAIAHGFSGTARESHILLAACNRRQQAYERNGTGLFTGAILQVLRSHDVKNLTYSSLMHRLDAPAYQTPHCAGKNVRRRLFDASAKGADNSLILCRLWKGKKHFDLEAGALQGVKAGSEYEMFENDLDGPSRGTAVVGRVDSFTSLLWPVEPTFLTSPLHRSRHIWYARLVKEAGTTFSVTSNDIAWLGRILKPDDKESGSISSQVDVVDDVSEADLILTVTGSTVHLARGTKHNIVDSGIGFPTEIPHTILAEAASQCRSVIYYFARFMAHLTRTASPPDGKEVVSISMKQLERKGKSVVPMGHELIEADSVVNLVVDKSLHRRHQPRYGLMLENITDVPLYVYIFYFDPNTSTIQIWYHPKLAAGDAAKSEKAVDTELEPGQLLAVGFGNGGALPWMFVLDAEQEVDVSMFKIFLSTKPADMSSLEQASPFSGQRQTGGGLPAPHQVEWWATKVLTVVQREKKS